MRLVPTSTMLSLSARASLPPQMPVPDVVEASAEEEPISGGTRFSARPHAVRRRLLRPRRIRAREGA